jgi:thioester reductase-like protein
VKTLFITGATGFIGSFLVVELLKKGTPCVACKEHET